MRVWTFVVGYKGSNYPTFVILETELQWWEIMEKNPKLIFFKAQIPDLDEDVRWFDGKPGPDWITDLDVLEVVNGTRTFN